MLFARAGKLVATHHAGHQISGCSVAGGAPPGCGTRGAPARWRGRSCAWGTAASPPAGRPSAPAPPFAAAPPPRASAAPAQQDSREVMTPMSVGSLRGHRPLQQVYRPLASAGAAKGSGRRLKVLMMRCALRTHSHQRRLGSRSAERCDSNDVRQYVAHAVVHRLSDGRHSLLLPWHGTPCNEAPTKPHCRD